MSKEQPRRLGRGLAALLGDDAVPASVNAPGVQSIAVDLLGPSPFQPRRAMDETALQELADSIAARGILQPLLVRPTPGVAGAYQIIAGERRWRAAQKVPLHEVPVLVREFSDSDAMAAGLVENLQREDLNPVEEAAGFERLMTEFKMTQETLAEAIGKSRGHISNLLRILKLPEKVLAMVKDGDLSLGHAKALMTHANPVQGAKLIVDKHMSVRQAEVMCADSTRTFKANMLNKPPPARKQFDDTDALAEQMSEKLGLKVKITFNGRSGAVTLNYASLDQLDGILALLNG
jgi:ParB family chromosome partitioning protein